MSILVKKKKQVFIYPNLELSTDLFVYRTKILNLCI